MHNMTQLQALALCGLLLDFEIEQPQVMPPPEAWVKDLQAARKIIRQMVCDLQPFTQADDSLHPTFYTQPGRKNR